MKFDRIFSYLIVPVAVFVSCSKDPLVDPQSSPLTYPANPLLVSTSNSLSADSLTGREFMFDNLHWTADSIGVVCILNRPDLFYRVYRPVEVFIRINESEWMKTFSCPYPTDPFYYDWLMPGILKFYVFNYRGSVMGATTSVKVRFL